MAESLFKRKRLTLSLRSKKNNRSYVKSNIFIEKENVHGNITQEKKNVDSGIEDNSNSLSRKNVLSAIENTNSVSIPNNGNNSWKHTSTCKELLDIIDDKIIFDDDDDDTWVMQMTNDILKVLPSCETEFFIPDTLFDDDPTSCPFYKRIPGTSFVVDAFSFGIIPGVTAYFLSHFHLDHYCGLESSFNKPIYCTSVTAALVKLKIGVDPKYLHTIDVEESINVSGVKVTALDANHCPGSVMFIFQLKNGRNVLHVGDFRADLKMESYPLLWNLHIDALYLDTTYCEPKYTFPTQEEIINKVVEVVTEYRRKVPQTLIACGTYSIGKERVFIAVAKALNAKLWTFPDKREVLECLHDKDISDRLVDDPCDAEVHIYPMGELHFDKLSVHLKHFSKTFTHLLAIKPSGWELKDGEMADISSQGNVTICGVPYSEHSSYTELERFVKFVRPARVVPTVNVENAAVLDTYVKRWLSEDEPDWRLEMN